MPQRVKRTSSEKPRARRSELVSGRTKWSMILDSVAALSKRKGTVVWAALLLVLLAWWRLPSSIAGMLFPIVWMVAVQLVFAGAFEAARLRRRAWLGQYLKKISPWSRWLRGGVVMVMWHQLSSAILAAVLLVSLRLAGSLDMILLVVGAVACWQCGRWARSRLARHVIPEYLSAVTRRLLVAPVSALLALALIVASLVRPQPYLVGMELGRAVQEHVAPSGQSLLAILERSASALELASFWTVQNALNDLGVVGWAAVLGWVGVFAIQGVMALAFVRLLVGAAAAHDALKRLGDHSSTVSASCAEDTGKGGRK